MAEMRFYPIAYHTYEDNRGTAIVIFAYDSDHKRIALRLRYTHWFYASLKDHSYDDIVGYVAPQMGATVADKDTVTSMGSTVYLHEKIPVIRVSCTDGKCKAQTLSMLKNRGVSTHDKDHYLTPLLKLMAEKDVSRYCWMEGDVRPTADRVTTMDREYALDIGTLHKVQDSLPPPPFAHLSFDIETDSEKHNRFPSALNRHDRIMVICLTFAHGDRYEEHSIVLGPDISTYVMDDAKQAGCKSQVHTVDTELRLIGTMFKLINHLDPDIIEGHNHLGFDTPYILDRLRLLTMHGTNTSHQGKGLNIPNLSRMAKYSCSARKVEWNNSQVAINGKYIDTPGRIWVDTLIVAGRQLFGNLPDNRLDTLASKFLGMTKDDVMAKDMFQVFKLYRDWTDPNAPFNKDIIKASIDRAYHRLLGKHNKEMPPTKDSPTVDDLNSLISMANMMNQRGTKLKIYSMKDALTLDVGTRYEELIAIVSDSIKVWNIDIGDSPTTKDMLDVMWWIVVKYCLQDTRIPYQTLEHQNIVSVLREQASIFSVDITDILTRGQVYTTTCAQYKYCHKRGVMMDFGNQGGPVTPYDYGGGYVGKGQGGLKTKEEGDKILTMDFASLYPTAIIAWNICYTTWVPPTAREAYLSDGTPNPEYIWLRYKDMILSDTTGKLQHIVDIPYDKRGEALCNIFHVKEGNHTHWFLKEEVLHGVVPDMLLVQLYDRRAVKGRMKEALKAGDMAMHTTYNAQQLAIKVVMNATYGAFGTRTNRLANFDAADTICYIGRSSILRCNDYLTTKGLDVVYNDTDSAMIRVNWKGDIQGLKAYGDTLAEELSSMFRKPMSMEFESIFLSYLLKGPKMYSGILCDGKSLDIKDYTWEYVQMMGLLYIKGMAPVRRDKYPYNKELLRGILYNILMQVDVDILIDTLETALTNIWSLKQGIKNRKLVEDMFSYNKGITPKAIEGGSGTMAKWCSIYEDRYKSKPSVGERFNLLVTVGADPTKHTMSADKLVPMAWMQGKELDVIHYINALDKQGNVVELLNLAYPDDVPRNCIPKWYLPNLIKGGSIY